MLMILTSPEKSQSGVQSTPPASSLHFHRTHAPLRAPHSRAAEIIRIPAASHGSAAFHAHDFDVARKKPVRRAEHAAWLFFCDCVLISQWVCFVFLVAGCRIDTGLLRLTILEEVNCNLREQCIGEDILILLLRLPC